MPKVLAVCISENKGERKKPVESVELRENHGIVGDAHAGDWHRQVSLLAQESIDKMRAMGLDVNAGDFAENITTSGIDLVSLPIGTRLQIGETLLEVTQIGKQLAIKEETTADQFGDGENNMTMWDGDGKIIKKPFRIGGTAREPRHRG